MYIVPFNLSDLSLIHCTSVYIFLNIFFSPMGSLLLSQLFLSRRRGYRSVNQKGFFSSPIHNYHYNPRRDICILIHVRRIKSISLRVVGQNEHFFGIGRYYEGQKSKMYYQLLHSKFSSTFPEWYFKTNLGSEVEPLPISWSM